MITEQNLCLLQQSLYKNDAVIILSPSNRFYFTGFESTAGFAFITLDKRYFVTDFRYIEAAKAEVKNFDVILQESRMFNAIGKLSEETGVSRFIFESEYVSINLLNSFKSAFKSFDFITDGELDKTVAQMRSIKSEVEIFRISAAASISEEALKRSLPQIHVGMTERTVAALIEYNMRLCGGDGVAFDTIAVAGVNSSKPHGVPSDYIIKNGDFLTIDFGAKYRGYCSDMTRTFAMGTPTEKMMDVYNTVLDAQKKALAEIAPDKICSQIDAVARDIINEKYNGCFGHGLGHSVGIDIHESPALSPSCSSALKENTLMTCEPGIYIEGEFGVRIEDLVVVTKDGYKNLNAFSKELIIL